ncbi:MAG: AAA family ATPase [Betaproteobacteria bacterium]|nr:AAA family ATPase [Betaproteobacteria bacterium]
MPEDKVFKTVASIAATHRRNHPVDDDPDTPLFDLQAASVGRFIGKDVLPRDWVLKDFIAKGMAGLLISPGGTGKSQLLLELAVDVATGQQYFSPWAPSVPGQVVIISAEDEEDEVHRRFARLVRQFAADPDGGARIRLLAENLYIVPRVGESNLLTHEQDGEIVPTALVDRLLQTLAPLRTSG